MNEIQRIKIILERWGEYEEYCGSILSPTFAGFIEYLKTYYADQITD